MGDEVWFPPGEAAMGRGEEEPTPDATMLMGDEVLREKEMEPLVFIKPCDYTELKQSDPRIFFFLWLHYFINYI